MERHGKGRCLTLQERVCVPRGPQGPSIPKVLSMGTCSDTMLVSDRQGLRPSPSDMLLPPDDLPSTPGPEPRAQQPGEPLG